MKDRISLYTAPFPWIDSYCQIIDLAAEYGLQAVEGFNNFEFAEPDPEAARQVRAYADEKGIVFSCLSVYADITGDNAAAQIQRLKDYAQIAAILGSPYLHHTIVPEHVSPNRVTADAQRLFHDGVAAVREIYDYAATLGVKTVYEDQGYIFNGVQGFGRFLREVGRDVGVVVDLGNIFQVDEKPEDFIAAFHDRAVHVHIKDVAYAEASQPHDGWLQTLHGNYFDPNRPGDGVIDLNKCISMLKQSGFEGFYALEFGAGPGGAEAYRSYIDQVEAWLKESN